MNDLEFYKEMYRRECAETERLRAKIEAMVGRAPSTEQFDEHVRNWRWHYPTGFLPRIWRS